MFNPPPAHEIPDSPAPSRARAREARAAGGRCSHLAIVTQTNRGAHRYLLIETCRDDYRVACHWQTRRKERLSPPSNTSSACGITSSIARRGRPRPRTISYLLMARCSNSSTRASPITAVM